MQRLNDGSVTSVSRQISWALDFTGENRSHKQAQILLPVSITFSELMEGLLAWGSPPMCPGGSSGEVKGAVNLPLCWLRRSSDPQEKTSPNLLCVSGCYDEHGPVEVAPPSGELQELQSRGNPFLSSDTVYAQCPAKTYVMLVINKVWYEFDGPFFKEQFITNYIFI